MLIPEEILNKFASVTLSEVNEIKLLDRVDIKYTFHSGLLNEILNETLAYYKILSIDGQRYAHYETRYYDTPDYQMYREHHNGKLNRNKVRFRTYLDTNIHFFEVKFKSNKGRTVKKRVKIFSDEFTDSFVANELLKRRTPYSSSGLQEALRVYYTRITLVSNNMKERLTIDTDLHYSHKTNIIGFPNMVIAEIKQEKSGTSPFINIMKKKRIRDISISKYCLGIASLVPKIKINNFKVKLQYVSKLCNATA